MPRSALLGLAALFAFSALDAGPASAQSGYRLYPWCAHYSTRGGATNCYFESFEQCRAAVSGVGGSCNVNPFYEAYGSYYQFNGAPSRRSARKQRRY